MPGISDSKHLSGNIEDYNCKTQRNAEGIVTDVANNGIATIMQKRKDKVGAAEILERDEVVKSENTKAGVIKS